MIVHIERRTTPFALIDKGVIEDTRLSWKAKGLMAYFLSRPESWKIITEDILNRSTDGRESVLAGMAELRLHGYAHLKTTRDEKGQVSGKHWVIYEVPTEPDSETIPPKTGKPEHRDSRRSDKPKIGKPATNNKEEESKTKKNSNNNPLPPKGGKEIRKKVSLEETVEWMKKHIPEEYHVPEFWKAWEDFYRMRCEIREPLSETSTRLAAGTLAKMGVESAIESLNQSTIARWSGVFPPRNRLNGNHKPQPKTHEERFQNGKW